MYSHVEDVIYWKLTPPGFPSSFTMIHFAFYNAGILRAYQYTADDECEQPISGDDTGNTIDPVSQEITMASQPDDVIVSPSPSQQEEEGEDGAAVSSEEKIMLSSLHIILDTLNEDTPQLVQEVKCVVQELRRITLLWDELWLGSLTQLNQESQRFDFIYCTL